MEKAIFQLLILQNLLILKANPPVFIIEPERINNGIAKRGKELREFNKDWEAVNNDMSKGKCKSITNNEDNAMVTDIGTPKNKNIAKVITKIIIDDVILFSLCQIFPIKYNIFDKIRLLYRLLETRYKPTT